MSANPHEAPDHPLGLRPSKIIAVHLNYPSRATERGRLPASPSYFLKPPSSLSSDGGVVRRPRGCELLNYEGEVGVVIGTRARRVPIERALEHIAGYVAANDFGVYDLRSADRGSNLISKGQDGFTPVGPRIAPAEELDPAAIELRTYLNGELVQEGATAELIFPIALLIADLSRFFTLEPGDLILTGTPANSRPVLPGDRVEVEVQGVGRLLSTIAEDEHELEPIGAMPHATASARAEALGTPAPRAAVLSAAARAALGQVSTATLTVQLRQRGLRNCFIAGLQATRPSERLLGFAFTLRYVPVREDIVAAAAATGELNAQKLAVETISSEEVLVIDARGEEGAGTIGDILAARALQRGAAGIITDGGLRDSTAVAALSLPVYFRARHAAVLGLEHYPLESGVPVACGGTLVMPGDVLVGDGDGVVVLPATLAEEVALDALAQEEREAFALERVNAGESVRELYPLAPERTAEFESWREARRKGGAEK